jgi:hypothetical protein
MRARFCRRDLRAIPVSGFFTGLGRAVAAALADPASAAVLASTASSAIRRRHVDPTYTRLGRLTHRGGRTWQLERVVAPS